MKQSLARKMGCLATHQLQTEASQLTVTTLNMNMAHKGVSALVRGHNT